MEEETVLLILSGKFEEEYRSESNNWFISKALKNSSKVRYDKSKGCFILEDNDTLDNFLESKEVLITNYDIITNNKDRVNNEVRSISGAVPFDPEFEIQEIN